MELVPNSFCSLCDENTSVLSKKAVRPFITEAGKVFFNADENAFKEFQDELLKRTICSICVQKISACTKFKNTYEAIKKSSGPKKARYCYVCEKKQMDCIKTFDDPNDIIAKFTLLTKYSSNTILYKDCEMCLPCLFDIHLWCELHNILIKRLNIDGQALKSFQRLNCTTNFTSGNGIVKKDKENVTPPHNNIISNKRLRTSSIDCDSKSRPSKKLFKQSRRSKLTLNRSTGDFFLSDKLKNFKCLRDGLFDELNCPDYILSDHKMLNQIPYVLIPQMELEKDPNTPERKSSRLHKPIEIIDIDSEDEPVKKTTRVSFQLPPKGSSPHFVKEIEDEKELKFTCNICDRDFLTRCNYKMHHLWHEKPEHCQVNLVRYDLPKRAKSSEFGANKITDSTTEQSARIDDIALKYIDTPVTEDNSEIMDTEAMDLSNKDESRCIESNNIFEIENIPNIVDSIESTSQNNLPEPEITTNVVDTMESISENDDKLSSKEEEDENETSTFNIDTCVALEEEHSLTDDKSGNDDVENEVESSKSISENFSMETCENTSENCENDIEKALAQLHDEDEIDVDDGDDKEENSNNIGEISDDKGDAVSDDDVDRNNLKRKRIDSPSSDDHSSSDDNMPKIKKVRFAIDYSYAKLTEQAANIQKEDNLINNEVSTPFPLYGDDN